MKKLKILYWSLLTVLYVHIAMRYLNGVGSFDTFCMLYAFGVIPLGYALSLVLFKPKL